MNPWNQQRLCGRCLQNEDIRQQISDKLVEAESWLRGKKIPITIQVSTEGEVTTKWYGNFELQGSEEFSSIIGFIYQLEQLVSEIDNG